MATVVSKQSVELGSALKLAASRKALESARANLTPGERMLLALSEKRTDVSRALVERLSGHVGIGQSSRVAKLTIVARTSRAVGG